jgi:hypothetical protein
MDISTAIIYADKRSFEAPLGLFDGHLGNHIDHLRK